jgi:hypothetical protein
MVKKHVSRYEKEKNESNNPAIFRMIVQWIPLSSQHTRTRILYKERYGWRDMPESLRHLQRVDLFKPGGYKKLVGALREDM